MVLPGAEWLSELTATGVEARHRALFEAALDADLQYELGPRLTRDGAVQAVVVHGPEALDRVGDRYEVTLAPMTWRAGEVSMVCSCQGHGGCVHGVGVLADLSLSAALAGAVAAGQPMRTREALRGVSALRRRKLAERRAERLVEAWVPMRALGETYEPVWSLSLPTQVPDTAALQTSFVGGLDGSPVLEVRFREPGRRAVLDPTAMVGHTLPPGDRAPFRMLHTAGSGKKFLKVSGADVSVVLRLLRDVAPSRRRLEGGGEGFDYDPRALRPVLGVAAVDPSLLRVSKASARGFRVESGVRGGRWEGPVSGVEFVPALEVRWQSEDRSVDLAARGLLLFRGPFACLWSPDTLSLYPVEAGVDLDVAFNLQRAPAIELVGGHEEALLRSLRLRMRGRGVVLPPAESLGVSLPTPAFVLKIEGYPLDLLGRLEARYPFATVPLWPDAPVSEDARRDLDVEASAMARVREAGLAWDAGKRCFSTFDEGAARFWRRGVAALDGADPRVEVQVPEALRGTRVRAEVVPVLRASEVRGELDISLQFESESSRVELAKMRDALEQKRRWVTLEDGSLAALATAVEDVLAREGEGLAEVDAVTLAGRLPMHQFGRVVALAESGEASLDAALEGLRRGLRAVASVPEVAVPRGLAASLRPYQLQGLGWLQWLDAARAGGVLADDMGLGKTLMALALVLWRCERDGPAPTLVVAPTSVVSNWAREAARFAPSLRVTRLHGRDANDRINTRFDDAELVLTSYGLLLRDAAWLAKKTFRAVIFDEAQTLKNAGAATTQAARSLSAVQKLCLSGTPVENRLLELWSLMDLVNPGMLGSQRAFLQRYERPVALAAAPGAEASRADEAQRILSRLRARLRPFVLRRSKAEVAVDLPPRQEVDLHCAMGPDERRRYDALARVLREEVGRAVRDARRPAMAVFTALLRLRQLACDPRLVDPSAEGSGAKREVFIARVRELAAVGRKVLVFSQFVELLTLWAGDLDREGVGYERLDGGTRDRDGVIARFAEGTATVFFISLKAGGTGLNLTMADTVIHADPWWNPAVEAQASDRAHRIGQTRAVTIYRLVARGTVEERVLRLQAHKRALAAEVLPEGELPQHLSEEDIAALLDDAQRDAWAEVE
ncbi:MAG: DEAD/DEAH box helicase [Myxococcales bacterium]|nr:DEAD/DEAH box helicase [Myxococcales bacterium]